MIDGTIIKMDKHDISQEGRYYLDITIRVQCLTLVPHLINSYGPECKTFVKEVESLQLGDVKIEQEED